MWLFWLIVLLVVLYSQRRFGTVPKREHLRDPNDLPLVATWNVFSDKKWTPEGIEFHERVLRYSLKVLVGFIALWFTLDLLS